MATFTSFEETEVWQKSRSAAKKIYEISELARFSRDFALKDQIRRAAISVMSNISEGFERDGDKEFVQFLCVSKGSAGEIKSQLYLSFDIGYIDKQTFDVTMQMYREISRMLGGFIKYLKKSNIRGKKFKKD
jgi:four helix bundle protein